mgnify:CR=1 FL=1
MSTHPSQPARGRPAGGEAPAGARPAPPAAGSTAPRASGPQPPGRPGAGTARQPGLSAGPGPAGAAGPPGKGSGDARGEAAPRVAVLAELLAAGGEPVSGEALATRLGLSRTAVWKHLDALRRQGMPIEARTRRGYRIDPAALERAARDRFFPDWLAARRRGCRLGHTVYWQEEIGSTNDWARRLAEAGAPEGTVAVADRQTAGRGRLRRTWWSPPGGLWMSTILRPRLLPARLPVLTLAVAAAVAEALEAWVERPVALKWPNDVEIDGRKVGGILLEMVAQPDAAEYVVAGTGINVSLQEAAVPAELQDRITWLAREAARPVTRNQLAEAILDRLEAHYVALHQRGPAEVLAAWRARAAVLGETVRVLLPAGQVVGTALDVDEDGALILEVPGAGRQRVLAGDVQRLRTL